MQLIHLKVRAPGTDIEVNLSGDVVFGAIVGLSMHS
jgi:hypothetical protein